MVQQDGYDNRHRNDRDDDHLSSPPSNNNTTSTSTSNNPTSIVVTGFSLRAPKSSSVQEFAEALKAGKDLTTANTRYPDGHLGLPPRQGLIKKVDIEGRFNASFFGLNHIQAEAMDPSLRMMLQVSYEALMDAQLDVHGMRGSKTGVYVAHSFSDTFAYLSGPTNPKKKTGYELVNGYHCMLANRLSYFYDFKGPSQTIDTGCSSSIVALDRAVQDIEAGTIDYAVVAGASLTLDPSRVATFNALKALSPTGRSYSFDTRANGYCRSEGIACIVLEVGTKGYARIGGIGNNSDGATAQGITYPSAQSQMELMLGVIKKSMIDPKTISYHEGHGTGTVAGDREELNALSKVYSHNIHIGSVKSNMGHTEPVSGLFGIIKILLMHEDQMLYPNYDWRESNHDAILNGTITVAQNCQDWKKGACSLSSFGLGGSNAFVILLPTARKDSPLPALLSGSSTTAVARPFLSSLPDESISVRSITMASLYEKYYRIQHQLSNNDPFQYEQVEEKWTKKSHLVFVLDGQGSQWNAMGRDLMKTNGVFFATIERLEKESGIPLIDLYEDGTKWMDKTKAVIGIVSFQLGIIAVLASHGISPDYFLGHSLGEITCSFLSGLQTEAEIMDVANFRASLATLIETNSRLDVFTKSERKDDDQKSSYLFSTQHNIQKTALSSPMDPNAVHSFSMRGKMAVVGCDAETLDGFIDRKGLKQTCVACYNSPTGQTVSGPTVEVDQLLEEITNANPATFVRTLSTDNVAYHAPYLEVFRDHLSQEFTNKYGTIENQPLPSSWKSTSRGKTFGIDYIVNNICGRVYFQKAIESLPRSSTVIEIGPSSSLLAQIKRIRTDLTLVRFVERNTRVDLDSVLNTLKPQFSSSVENKDQTSFLERDSTMPLNYKERYPDLWGNQPMFKLPSWKEYSVGSPRVEDGTSAFESSTAQTVYYNLIKAPWSSLLDHNIRGQILFPAAGFLHALWSSQRFNKGIELANVKVQTPLLISPSDKDVKLYVYQTGAYCEVRGMDNVCHVTAYVKQVLPTTARIKPRDESNVVIEDGLDSKHFYSHVRRMGYNYGQSYQLLDDVTPSHARFGKTPQDWICYLDACLHLALHNTKSFFYPTGFSRVVFWGDRLHKASMWIKKKSDDSFGNETILLEGVEKEFALSVPQSISTYSERFIKYHESDQKEDPSAIASLLLRESTTFHVVEPIRSTELGEIVKQLQYIFPETTISNQTTDLVISDGIYPDANLLLTTSSDDDRALQEFPNYVVARWGDICLLRRRICDGEPAAEPTIVTDWKDVRKSSDPFVWYGDGASGAVKCLHDERNDRKAISYEGGSIDNLIGVEKSMRHNYIHDGVHHGCWVDVKDTNEKDDNNDKHQTSHAKLQIGRPGLLDSLHWRGLDVDDCDVEIRASGLNFRDVMRAMGQLKEDDVRLGLEYSGVNIKTEERVFGFGSQTLATHAKAYYSFPTPEYLSDEEAATIPVVYSTVYYALLEKANMKKGQSVLIHAGAGGVGLAAIAVAQSRGFKIFTTCSAPKREFLKTRFGLEDHQIGDSRSDNFVNTVLKGTNQRGVDVVLNQLAGELQVASMRCLAPGGHFCEIGKYDVMENTAISLGLMANNISFHVIDLLQMFVDPANKSMFDKLLSDGFERNEIAPLPITTYNTKDVVEAFRYMSQGRHIGKVVINGYGSYKFPVERKAVSMQGETHLITGGLGGVGLALAYKLASLKCREVILISRRGVINFYQRQQIAEMEAMHCKVQVLKCDVADLTPSLASPDFIWHIATVYKDVVFDKMTPEDWDYVTKPKVDGYKQLRKCWPRVQIVATSSVFAYYGGGLIHGQTSYALSNAFLDQAARKDANTLSVRIGPIDDVGYITGADLNRKIINMGSLITMKIDSVLEKLLNISRQHQNGVFGIYSFKERDSSQRGIGQTRKGDKVSKTYTIKAAQSMMATVMGGKPDQYYSNLNLYDAGLDSLSKMEVVHHIHEMSCSKSFKPSDIDDSFVVEDIVSAIVSAMDDTSGGLSSQVADDKVGSKITEDIFYEFDDSTSEEENGAHVENEINLDHQSHKDERDTSSVVQNNTSSIHYNNDVEKSSTSVFDFIGINSVKDDNENVFLTVEVEPHNIDFERVMNALATTKFIIFRQSDPIIFNHGAPLDSEKDASAATFMDQYVALAQALSTSKAIIMVIIEGEVRGGGMIFPALADICIATPNSSFGLPEIHRGMVPAVVSQALKERLGNITTRRLALTGERISADKALQISLIDSVVEESELERHLKGILRRWEPRVSAAQFIKHNLLPTNSNSLLMRVGGTRAGEWFNAQRHNKLKVDDREVLRVSLIDGVATLTMCDEVTFNSATYEMSEAILAIIPRLREEANVIILQSSFQNFHLGLQASTARKFRSRSTHETAATIKGMFQGFVDLAQLGIPIIGVLNGKIFGGGVPVVLWCDFRIVTSDVDIHVGNISRGVSPCGQLSNLLNEYFPRAEVLKHYLGNHHWYAKDLLRLGIVDHIKKTQSDAMKEAQALARFIAQQPARGVRDSMHILKVSHAAELIDEEAWLMAAKATQTDDCFSNKNHGSFQYDDEGGNVPLEDYQLSATVPRQPQSGDGAAVGIVAMEVYFPHYCIDADVLEENHIPARTKNGQDAVAVWDGSEDAISMALNAVSMLLEKHVKDPRMIGRIEVGTESNVDMAKSIKSYIMDLLPKDHKNVEGVDNTNACYGGAAAMINTLSWCREARGRYGIVVATDTTDMDLSDSSWRGASAVAVLIGPNPWIEIHPERASCFSNSHDFVKPRYSERKTPYVQAKTSVKNYVDALDFTVKEFRKLHAVDPSSFDTLVFHGGMSVTFQKLIERHLLMNVCSKRTWRTTFEMMEKFGSKLGGLCTSSMFVQLLSLLDSYSNLDGEELNLLPPLNHIGLFAYGSGSTATLFHAKIHHKRRHEINLSFKLKMREKVTFDVLSSICKAYSRGATTDMTFLPRLNGRFYFDVSKKDQIIREYFKEGTLKRLSPESQEPYTMSALDKEAITAPSIAPVHPCDGNGLHGGGRCNHDQDESWARTKVMMSFIAGIIWWISVAVAYEPRHLQADKLGSMVFTFIACSLIHIIIHRQSTHDGSRIFHPLSCSHFVQATIMYISYMILYTFSPPAFHKYWMYIILTWVTYISGMMVASKEAWESIDRNQRLFWIIHHNLSFFFLGMVPLISADSWDEVSIKSCYIFLVAQIWNSSLNVYRSVYGNGGGSYSLTQKQIIVMRTFATLVEKTQQIYAASLQCWGCRSTGQGIFWTPVLVMLFMIILELSFQVSALYRPLRKDDPQQSSVFHQNQQEGQSLKELVSQAKKEYSYQCQDCD